MIKKKVIRDSHAHKLRKLDEDLSKLENTRLNLKAQTEKAEKNKTSKALQILSKIQEQSEISTIKQWVLKDSFEAQYVEKLPTFPARTALVLEHFCIGCEFNLKKSEIPSHVCDVENLHAERSLFVEWR